MNPVWLVPPLMLGLLGGTHCIAMCGGVVAMTCSSLPLKRRGRLWAQLPYVLAYNTGRIASYTIAGAAAGGLGATFAHFDTLARCQLTLRLVAGATMLAVGLYIAGVTAALRWLERAAEPLWRRIAPLARSLVPVRSPSRALALGLLWGWMPCGLVYAALAMSLSAGSATAGALTMAAFGLGTLPMLVTMGSAAALVVRAARAPGVRKAAGVAMLVLGGIQVVDAGLAWGHASDGAARACCFLHRHS
jgi:sulfite exporter TauE/SafE